MLTHVVIWLNRLSGAAAGVVLAPIAWVPGWLSSTAIAVVTGVAMLVVFQQTSHQTALRRTRNRIKAHLLSLTLFRDELRVSLRAQGELLIEAGRLLGLSLVPMLVMLIPMSLLLGQLALWYQARPLAVGEDAVVTVQLRNTTADDVSNIELLPSDVITIVTGPVRVLNEHMVCWDIHSDSPGRNDLTFQVGANRVTKQLTVGDGFLPVSLQRPPWSWNAALLHPAEEPLPADSPVESIEIAYPKRLSWTAGTDTWLIYWFVISMMAALAARPMLNVNL